MAKGLKIQVRKFFGLNPTFAEVTEEKLVGGLFAPILNRVKGTLMNQTLENSEKPKFGFNLGIPIFYFFFHEFYLY